MKLPVKHMNVQGLISVEGGLHGPVPEASDPSEAGTHIRLDHLPT